MKTKITFLALAIFLLNLISTNQMNAQRIYNNSSNVFSIIRVVNSSSNTISVLWNDNNYDEIEILTENSEVFMPTIPLNKTNQIHLNDLIDGVYFINFKQSGSVVNTKVIQVKGHQFVQESI